MAVSHAKTETRTIAPPGLRSLRYRRYVHGARTSPNVSGLESREPCRRVASSAFTGYGRRFAARRTTRCFFMRLPPGSSISKHEFWTFHLALSPFCEDLMLPGDRDNRKIWLTRCCVHQVRSRTLNDVAAHFFHEGRD